MVKKLFHNKGKVAIISGAMGYVGSAIAQRLASDGMKVALLYRTTSEETVARVLSDLSGRGHRAYYCDLNNDFEIEHIIQKIVKDMGSPYACIHATGSMPKQKQLYLSSVKDIREQLKNVV